MKTAMQVAPPQWQQTTSCRIGKISTINKTGSHNNGQRP